MALTNCPICKSRISTEATICPTCGYKLTPKVICPECGAIIEKDDTYCKSCGFPMPAEKVTIDETGTTGQTFEKKQKLPKLFSANKKIIIIAAVVILAIIGIISIATSGSNSGSNTMYDVYGDWETYASLSSDGTYIDYDDLSTSDWLNLYMSLELDYDNTYVLNIQGEDLTGEWEIATNGEITLYQNGNSVGYGTLIYNASTDEVIMDLDGHEWYFERY